MYYKLSLCKAELYKSYNMNIYLYLLQHLPLYKVLIHYIPLHNLREASPIIQELNKKLSEPANFNYFLFSTHLTQQLLQLAKLFSSSP